MAAWTPTVTVEAAFGFGPFDDTPSWTDITASVSSVRIDRGRSSEFEQFPAGTCSIVLVDHDRRFDPTNAAGPYYGNLVPNVPIRVVADHGGTDFPRFYGFVDGWNTSPHEGDHVSFVTVSATDATKLLGQRRLPQSAYEATVLVDGPVGYWRLDETSGDVATERTTARNDGDWHGTNTIARGTETRYGGAGATFPGELGAYVAARPTLSDFPCTVEFWCIDAASGLMVFQPGELAVSCGPLGLGSVADFASLKGVNVIRYASTPFGAADTPIVDVNDGAPHHVVVTYDSSGDGAIYIDGKSVGESGGVLMPASTAADGTYLGGLHVTQALGVYDGTISDVAIYDTDLSDTQIGDHYQAGIAPWDNELTGDRIERILDLIGWPSALRALDRGTVLLGPADLGGRTVWEYLQSIAAAEQGRLFVAQDGMIEFHDAATLSEDTTAAATFSDDGADIGYLTSQFHLELDDRLIYNKAVVSREGGSTQTAEDPTSIDAYGERVMTISGLLLRSDVQARRVAERTVMLYSEPRARVDAWQVNPQKKPETWPDVLALDIGAHVTVEAQPSRVGARIEVELDVERIAEDISPSAYVIEFRGSPRDPNIGSYFTWDGDGATQGWNTGKWR